MTSQQVKFYKFSSSASDKITAAKGTQGAIIYIVDLKELWIGGATANAAELVIMTTLVQPQPRIWTSMMLQVHHKLSMCSRKSII